MTKTFKIILILVAVPVVTSAPLHAARVNNVNLSYQDGNTVARVDVEGTIRFSHQTEVAKDGKPYRVILDVLSATHNLGAKNFLDLQTGVVQHLRTSQYQVKPEKVVRLVFDMKGETPYRVESNNTSVTLIFSDNSGTPFTAWSSADATAAMNAAKPEPVKPAPMAQTPQSQSAPASPAVTVAEKNASIENDRQDSLAPAKPAAKQVTTGPKIETGLATKVAQSGEFYGPVFAAPAETPAAPKPKPVVAEQPKAVPPPVAQTPQADSKPASPVLATKDQAPAEAAKVDAEKPVIAAIPEPQSPAATSPAPEKVQPQVVPEGQEPIEEGVTPADFEEAVFDIDQAEDAALNAEQQEKPEAGAEQQDDQKSSANRSTARFRRDADRKIKGTVVAEFPKRLVIKYKSNGKRDPFETLINETKMVNNPVEARVPNVEGLRLVGVIEGGNGENSALCEDKDNYGYILKAGDKVQKGYVLRVAPDRVFFQIFEYGWSRTVALNLQEY